MSARCPLCATRGETLLARGRDCRVIWVDDADYPGYCRVIWNSHVKEMTDLKPAQRARCMRVVLAVEAAVRAVCRPDKINLASFGTMVPHLHWHIIPRYADDAHFPDPVWAKRRRKTPAARQRNAVKWRTSLKKLLAQIL